MMKKKIFDIKKYVGIKKNTHMEKQEKLTKKEEKLNNLKKAANIRYYASTNRDPEGKKHWIHRVKISMDVPEKLMKIAKWYVVENQFVLGLSDKINITLSPTQHEAVVASLRNYIEMKYLLDLVENPNGLVLIIGDNGRPKGWVQKYIKRSHQNLLNVMIVHPHSSEWPIFARIACRIFGETFNDVPKDLVFNKCSLTFGYAGIYKFYEANEEILMHTAIAHRVLQGDDMPTNRSYMALYIEYFKTLTRGAEVQQNVSTGSFCMEELFKDHLKSYPNNKKLYVYLRPAGNEHDLIVYYNARYGFKIVFRKDIDLGIGEGIFSHKKQSEYTSSYDTWTSFNDDLSITNKDTYDIDEDTHYDVLMELELHDWLEFKKQQQSIKADGKFDAELQDQSEIIKTLVELHKTKSSLMRENKDVTDITRQIEKYNSYVH